MSVVYKGMDTSLNREVAVKVLHPHLASADEAFAIIRAESDLARFSAGEEPVAVRRLQRHVRRDGAVDERPALVGKRALIAHQRYGRPRLDAAQADAYVAEMARVGRELGVLNPPTNVAALADALDAFRPELTGTREAIEAARFLLVTPPLPLPARPFYAVLAAAAVETLPAWAREMLRLPVRPPVIGALEPALVRPAGEFLVRSLRWALTSPFRSPA